MTNLTKLTTQELLETGIVYIIVGKEKGSQGTFHFQGYTEFSSRIRMSQVKSILGTQRLHLEASKGTWEQNKEYCSKDGDVLLELGQPKDPLAGRRKGGAMRASQLDERLTSVKEILDQGGKIEDCWEQDFSLMVRYGRGIYEYALLKGHERIPPKVTVLTGAAGTGKTRFVHDHARIFYDGDLWSYPGNGWFDGYSGHRIALFDDFRGDLPYDLLLKVLDRYPLRVPVKGGFRNWNPVHIFITSNKSWDEWYPNMVGACRDALRRRIRWLHVVNENIYD